MKNDTISNTCYSDLIQIVSKVGLNKSDIFDLGSSILLESN